MPGIITSYYQGILQRVRSEVDLINSLFKHQGIKGEGNEIILRELLRHFIPQKYGVGTGVIIDHRGKSSNQIDIIIYDAFLYPSLLSLTTVHLFPVDIVYATIEVKTTLTKTKAQEALDNVASVRRLQIIPDTWTTSNVRPEGTGYTEHFPVSPMGFIFAYNSQPRDFQTLRKWFIPSVQSDISHWPTLIACLVQGLLGFVNELNIWHPQPKTGMHLQGEIIPLKNSLGEVIEFLESRESYTENGIDYPVKRRGSKTYTVIDQSRVLLLFMLYLHELLQSHPINPAISFIDTYFGNEGIEDGYYI